MSDLLAQLRVVIPDRPLAQTTLEQFEVLQSANQRSTFLLMGEGVRLMLEARLAAGGALEGPGTDAERRLSDHLRMVSSGSNVTGDTIS
ncbi:MAG TPA: hypothetical protein VMU40_19425 [Steroidobacteraceae bacterium]|nr:hypothetical protein [Steroidobacteraceae bacterium]